MSTLSYSSRETVSQSVALPSFSRSSHFAGVLYPLKTRTVVVPHLLHREGAVDHEVDGGTAAEAVVLAEAGLGVLVGVLAGGSCVEVCCALPV